MIKKENPRMKYGKGITIEHKQTTLEMLQEKMRLIERRTELREKQKETREELYNASLRIHELEPILNKLMLVKLKKDDKRK